MLKTAGVPSRKLPTATRYLPKVAVVVAVRSGVRAVYFTILRTSEST